MIQDLRERPLIGFLLLSIFLSLPFTQGCVDAGRTFEISDLKGKGTIHFSIRNKTKSIPFDSSTDSNNSITLDIIDDYKPKGVTTYRLVVEAESEEVSFRRFNGSNFLNLGGMQVRSDEPALDVTFFDDQYTIRSGFYNDAEQTEIIFYNEQLVPFSSLPGRLTIKVNGATMYNIAPFQPFGQIMLDVTEDDLVTVEIRDISAIFDIRSVSIAPPHANERTMMTNIRLMPDRTIHTSYIAQKWIPNE